MLPGEYKVIFGFAIEYIGVIGIIINDKVRFYEYENKTWEIISDADMILPGGYKGAFGFAVGNIIGIIINDRIQDRVQFYEYRNNTWTIISALDYII
jgi:hypothetical protein